MKKMILAIGCLMMMVTYSFAEDAALKDDKLKSEKLEQTGKSLDNQMTAITKEMLEIIQEYKLVTRDDIRYIPYQTTYDLIKDAGGQYIELEKHGFLKEDQTVGIITGIQRKKVKIYTDGNSISKLEIEIYERDYFSGANNTILITDLTPMTPPCCSTRALAIVKPRPVPLTNGFEGLVAWRNFSNISS